MLISSGVAFSRSELYSIEAGSGESDDSLIVFCTVAVYLFVCIELCSCTKNTAH